MLENGISTTQGAGTCVLCTQVAAEAGGNCGDYPSCTAGCLRGIEDPNMQSLRLKIEILQKVLWPLSLQLENPELKDPSFYRH